MNYADAEITRRVTEALLSRSEDVKRAWLNDAEFHALLIAKVNLLVSELDSMACAADTRMHGREIAANRIAHQAFPVTSPSAG